MKITSNIYLVGGPDISAPSDAAVYLIRSGDQAALIDAGTGKGTDTIISNIRETNTDPSMIGYIFLTHCHYDHTGGAEGLRALTGSMIAAHELDAAFLEAGDSHTTAASWYGTDMSPFNVDIKVTEKERTFNIGDLALKCIHTPGHSPGSSVLTVVSDNKLVLFGQDIHGPLNDSLRSSRDEYNRSLEFLLTLDADILCEGHFGLFHGKDRVREFIESYL